jgi:hypothetical protein
VISSSLLKMFIFKKTYGIKATPAAANVPWNFSGVNFIDSLLASLIHVFVEYYQHIDMLGTFAGASSMYGFIIC